MGQQSQNEKIYYDLLDALGRPVCNYYEYLSIEPINFDIELSHIKAADMNKCLALLIIILREDHVCNGSLLMRVENGQVKSILKRILFLLKNNSEVNGSESID